MLVEEGKAKGARWQKGVCVCVCVSDGGCMIVIIHAWQQLNVNVFRGVCTGMYMYVCIGTRKSDQERM